MSAIDALLMTIAEEVQRQAESRKGHITIGTDGRKGTVDIPLDFAKDKSFNEQTIKDAFWYLEQANQAYDQTKGMEQPRKGGA